VGFVGLGKVYSMDISNKDYQQDAEEGANPYGALKANIQRAILAVKAAECVAENLLTDPNDRDVNLSKVAATLSTALSSNSGSFGVRLPSKELRIEKSPVPKALWVLAIEEILWNAKKYGATNVNMWQNKEDYLCFGNNSRSIKDEDIERVNGGGCTTL